MDKLITIDKNNDLEYSGFKLHKTGLEAIGDPSFEQWSECGRFIQKANGSVNLWLGDWLNYGEKKWGEKYAQAIEETGLEEQTLTNAAYVAKHVDFSRRRENLPFSQHAEVASLEPDKQTEVLDWAEAEHATVREVREKVKEIKRPHLISPPLPNGKYDVIYADPPWKYDFSLDGKDEIENKYPTMELEEICALNIPAAENSVLFLWATAPKLQEALEVMKSWGFDYKTHSIWNKDWIGMGYWFRGQHELLLVGVKGIFSPPTNTNRVASVYTEKRTEHSKKPEYYYDLIEKMLPNKKYLELFAREPHSGWEVWGNEV